MEQNWKSIYSNRYHETSQAGRGFWRLMLAWQGSVFKLIWSVTFAEFLIFKLSHFPGASFIFQGQNTSLTCLWETIKEYISHMF